MDKEESIDGGPSAESYARLAQAQAMSRNITLDQLRLERDVSVTAGITPSVRQQTIVGNISGAGNRHVIEDAPNPRRIQNIPIQVFDGIGSGSCSPSAPPGSGTWLWGAIGGVCQWISTTDCP